MKNGWQTKKLGELCKIELGRTPARANAAFWDEKRETNNVWLSIADLLNAEDDVVVDSKEYVSDKGAEICKLVPKGTLLVSFKLTLGRLAFAGRDLFTNEAIAALTIFNESELSKEFLFYFLHFFDWVKAAENDVKLKGMTLNKAKLKEMDVHFPKSLAEQQRIVGILDEAFAGLVTAKSDRHGYQVAIASQLGVLKPDDKAIVKGFEKFAWLPAMNTPVFAVPEAFGKDIIHVGDADFKYGTVPHTSVSVTGAFADVLEYHTAILGVTGAGKTELAFELLRHALAHNTKVICIDLTAKYEGRLTDLKPHNLSISGPLSAELGQKLFDVETGKFGAPDEKKALKQLSDKLRADVAKNLAEFLESRADDRKLGIITLNEVSNTKATLFITELYMTCLLNFARDHADKCPHVLLVVEEAHTVMPEANTMGLGDFDSKGLVAKIAQIALQGRKYHVGLLVIAQRTATVSKTVLTQCNTMISFSCFDDTSLGFFENFFGKTHTETIPNLQFLQAVMFGKGVKSQRPIIVQIPFDPKKAQAK